MQRVLCDAFDASANLATSLHDLANQWAAPKQKKGLQLHPAQSRNHLCTAARHSAPCHLFERPNLTLASLALLVAERPLRLLSLGADPPPHQLELAEQIRRRPGWSVATSPAADGAPPHVLLLPRHDTTSSADVWLAPPLQASVNRPQLVLVFAHEELTASNWGVESWPLARLGFSRPFLLPGEAAEREVAERLATAATKAATARRKAPRPTGGKKKKQSKRPSVSIGPPRHGVALLWRSRWEEGACTPPLWALEETAEPDDAGCRLCGGPDTVPVEAATAAVTAAASARVPFAEYFACATMAPLQPLARSFFVTPRARGKSVWKGCFEASSTTLPCVWFAGDHRRGEHFTMQVLSSPEVLLSRLTAYWEAAHRASGRTHRPLLVVDPFAGEANYTQHLPDGLGRVPALRLASKFGWRAALAEPNPSTFAALRANFAAAHIDATRFTLQSLAVSPNHTAARATMYALEPNVAHLLEGSPLPQVTRQRLQWGTSTMDEVPRSIAEDHWQIDFLTGGPLLDLLSKTNKTAADAFRACRQSGSKHPACFGNRQVQFVADFVPWPQALERLGLAIGEDIDLLVVNLRDGSVDELLRAFPFGRNKPSIIYFRHAKGAKKARGLVAWLESQGYTSSSHVEVSAWGENSIAWRSDRCGYPGMPGRPLWWPKIDE